MNPIIQFGLVSGVIGLALWFFALLSLRSLNFCNSGERRSEIRNEENRAEEVKYHNEAIYRDFEYFFKVTLAILGGIAFVVTREKDKIDIQSIIHLLTYAGLLQFVAALIFSLFVFFHQKSKVERWHKRFLWYQPFGWQECWMVVFMFAISGSVTFGAIPEVIAILECNEVSG